MRPLSWFLLTWALLAPDARAGVWKAHGEIGMAAFYAEFNEESEPPRMILRIENHSRLYSVKMPEYYVQMTDGKNRPIRQIPADELVSARLARLRKLLPQHGLEINQLMQGIRADFPQQKIMEVYAQLKNYNSSGRPIQWRTWLENFLTGTPYSDASTLPEADRLIEEIGFIGRNTLWANDLAPDSQANGLLYFEKPSAFPLNVFFYTGEQFIGTRMQRE